MVFEAMNIPLLASHPKTLSTAKHVGEVAGVSAAGVGFPWYAPDRVQNAVVDGSIALAETFGGDGETMVSEYGGRLVNWMSGNHIGDTAGMHVFHGALMLGTIAFYHFAAKPLARYATQRIFNRYSVISDDIV